MTQTGEPAEKNRRLMLLTTLVLIGTSVSIGFHYVLGQYLRWGYPYDTFLFFPQDHFNDFFNVYRDVQLFNTHVPKKGIQYTPFTHMLMTVMRVIPANLAFVLVMGAFVATLVWFLVRFATDVLPNVELRIQSVVILTALAYPFLMVFDRSNLEALVFPAIAGFFYFYYLRPEKKRWLAYICLAVAICLKIYPATLLLIPLSDKRFKGALYTALGCLAAEGVSMFALGVVTGDGFVGTIQAAVRAVQGGQGQHLLGVHMAHSLFGAIALLIEPFTRAEAILAVVRPYLAFTIVVFAAIAAYVLFVEKEPWRKAALLLLSALVLPYVSSDYTLIQLYPAIVLFLAAGGMSRARATTYTVLFAVLLVPTDYYVFQSPRFLSRMAEHMVSEVSTSVLVYPAVMLTIMALIVYDGFRQRRETRA